MKVIHFLVKGTGLLIGLSALFVVAMALAGPLGWPFELFASWPYLVALIGLTGALISGLSGWPKLGTAIVAGALVVVAFAMASPGDLTRPAASAPVPGNLHLIWGNAMRQSGNVETLMARSLEPTTASPATVIAIAEMPIGWDWQPLKTRQILNRVRGGLSVTEIGVEGCAATKETFAKVTQRHGKIGKRVFALKVACPDYTLFAVHLTNPLWQWGQRLTRRNEELTELAAAIKNQTGPVVVIGDFNTPPNALPLSRFMTSANVDHTSCGGRWRPTWRPYNWRGKFNDANPLTGIPIDHLFTRDIEVVSCIVDKDFGSDHLPLVVELKKPTALPAAQVLPTP
jgi:Endonuclease/Exonuclease/phosphatase family